MTNKVKSKIHQLMANRINQIEQILAGNHDKMERLTNARFDVRQLLADYHVTELVQHTDKKVMELTEVNDIKPETFDWRKSVLTCKGKDVKPFFLLRTNMLSMQSPRYRFMMKPQHDMQILLAIASGPIKCISLLPFTAVGCLGHDSPNMSLQSTK